MQQQQQKKLRIYVSGPITGIANANLTEFQSAADLVRWAGAEPVLPHDIMPGHEGACYDSKGPVRRGHSWSCHMRADLVVMLGCDGLVMLPGWEASQGARIEHTTAAAAAVPIHYLGEHGIIKTSSGSYLFEAVREAEGVDA